MQDLPDVVPLLVCADIEREHAFVVRAFGFRAGLIERTESGDVVHGEVHAGRQVIWLHRVLDSAEGGWVPPSRLGVTTGSLVVRVDDIDAHCHRARAAGAEIEYEPMDQPYGVREYGARDPEGHRWTFVVPLD